MKQSARKLNITPRRGEEEEDSPTHENQNAYRSESLPSSSSLSQPDRRIEMARLLKSCGVKFYGPLAGRYPASLIEAKVEEWREDPNLGPGMLVRMIQEGGPIVEGLPDSGPEEEAWLERRYAKGKRRLEESS